MNLGAVATYALLFVGPLGCQDHETSCKSACERPFDLEVEKMAARTRQWTGLSPGMAQLSAHAQRTWTEKLGNRRAKFVEVCVPTCIKDSDRQVVECRQSARNLGEWKRCDQ